MRENGEENPSKCKRKTILTFFFTFELIAFTLSLIALISPSWQYAFLENGRTEHQHGLWLDCKRDYSNEYGRTRDFYETLYRLDRQQNPLDQFFLPPINCVYKFDYYIDAEDLYDHNHDENRLQNDADQHLFQGWKIATLVAVGLAVLFSAVSLLVCICAFCHRSLISASTVLVCVAVLLSTTGLVVFFICGYYQDSNVIKEEDGLYEQYFGWAFYTQIVGTAFHFLASLFGCMASAVAFKKAQAKLVKIEVVDDGNSRMLSKGGSENSFKRSFSAIFRVDSSALRCWEKDYLDRMETETSTKFKRAASLPHIKHKSKNQVFHSSSSSPIDSEFFNYSSSHLNTDYIPTFCPETTKAATIKSALKQTSTFDRQYLHEKHQKEIAYESLRADVRPKLQQSARPNRLFESRSNLSDRFTQSLKDSMNDRKNFGGTTDSLNVYDHVYDHISEQSRGIDAYEQPNCSRGKSSVSSFMDQYPTSGTGQSQLLKRLSSPKPLPRSTITGTECSGLADTPNQNHRRTESINNTEIAPSIVNLPVTSQRPIVPNKRLFEKRNEFTASEEYRRTQEKIRNEAIRAVSGMNLPVKANGELPSVAMRATSNSLTHLHITNNFGTILTDERKALSDSTSEPPSAIDINTFDDKIAITPKFARPLSNPNYSYNNNLTTHHQLPLKKTTFDTNSNIGSNSLMKSTFLNLGDAHYARDYDCSKLRKYAANLIDDADRSLGSSATMDSDSREGFGRSTSRDPSEFKLNLFMNNIASDGQLETHASSDELLSSLKEICTTTV